MLNKFSPWCPNLLSLTFNFRYNIVFKFLIFSYYIMQLLKTNNVFSIIYNNDIALFGFDQFWRQAKGAWSRVTSHPVVSQLSDAS